MSAGTSELSLSVYQSYSSIWREIDNREYHSLAAHPQLLNKLNDRAPNDYTPLFLACLRQDGRIIKFLLEMGAEVNAECRLATPIFICCLKAETESVEDLLAYGANPNILCTVKKISPLHLAAAKGMLELCKLLVSRGADINVQSPKYGTPLHIAVSKNHQYITSYFISNGAALNHTNQEGETAFHVAVRLGHLEIVRMLMEQQTLIPNTKESQEGNTVLHLACLYNRETIALMIIHKFPDLIYVRNNERQTPLFYGSDAIRSAIKNAFINKKHGFLSAVNNKTFSDIKFIVEAKPLYAHKIIIKQRCLPLYNECKSLKEVNIRDVPNAVFLALLHYLYTDLVDCDRLQIPTLIKCAEHYGLTRLKKLCLDITSKSFVEVPESTFASDMARCINSEEYSDVTFIVEDKPLYAHRILLGQSQYFKAMLEPGRLRESQAKEVPILGVAYDVFEVLIHYAYTFEMKQVTPEDALDVLQAIDYFQFTEGLKHCCEAYLCTQINKHSVCNLFQLADMCGSLFLKEECFDYIVTNHKYLSATTEYQNMPKELLQELEEYLKRQQEIKEKKAILVKRTEPDKGFYVL